MQEGTGNAGGGNASGESETGIAEKVTETTETMSVWDLVLAGEWYIMIPLGILSIFAVYIFVERFMAIQKATKGEKTLMPQIKGYIQEGKLDAARNLCSTQTSPIARMIDKGISKIGKPLKDISAAVENVGRLEIGRLEKRLSVLATIAGAAPMIGFLGTTIGMVRAFNKMAQYSTIELSKIAPEIMQAMVTTVGGLIVGIIAFITYNYLVAKVEKVIHKMEGTAMDFVDLLDEPGK